MNGRTKIEGADWTMKLADAVDDAAPGDTIEVSTWHAAQMGHTAARAKGGEDHGLVFECGGKRVDYLDADDPPAGSGFDAEGYPE
jgi:hypothetical protein